MNDIIIDKGAMPNMKSVYIDSCMELMTVPKGIEYLQQLDLESVSIKLQNRIEGEGSLDSPKLHYIW